MYTDFILAVFAVSVLIGVWIKNRSIDYFLPRLCGVLLVLLIVSDTMGDTLAARQPQIRVVVQTSDLASMHTDSSLTGTFLDGSGSIDQTPIYRMLIRNADGSVYPSSVEADLRVKIIEDKSLDSTGTWTTTALRTLCPAALVVWMPFGCIEYDSGYQHEFHVPVGSVVRRFDVR